MQSNEITSKHREILRGDALFMCCPCVQVRGRDNFELLMKIKDSLELVDLVPQPLLDSYRQQTQQQLLQRPWVTVTVHHRPATSKPDDSSFWSPGLISSLPPGVTYRLPLPTHRYPTWTSFTATAAWANSRQSTLCWGSSCSSTPLHPPPCPIWVGVYPSSNRLPHDYLFTFAAAITGSERAEVLVERLSSVSPFCLFFSKVPTCSTATTCRPTATWTAATAVRL